MVTKRISTTLTPQEQTEARKTGRTYRQLINIGVMHLKNAPKIIEERHTLRKEIDDLKQTLNTLRKEFYKTQIEHFHTGRLSGYRCPI